MELLHSLLYPDLSDIIGKYLEPQEFTKQLLSWMKDDPNCVVWHPGCTRVAKNDFSFRIVERDPFAPWKKPPIPDCLSIIISFENITSMRKFAIVIHDSCPENNIQILQGPSGFMCINCDKGTLVYDELLEHSILAEAFPEWYAEGRF